MSDGGRALARPQLVLTLDSSAKTAKAAGRLPSDVDWPRMLDAFADAAAIVDDELVVLEVNAVMCAHLKAAREDFIGSRLALSAGPEHPGSHHELARLEADGVLRSETQLRCLDGSVIDVEFTTTVIASGLNMIVLRKIPPVPAARASEFAASQASEAVAQQELNRQVLDSSVDAYWALDAGGHVLEWNRAAVQMFGWTREEATGRLLTELLVTADQREWVSQDIRRYVEAGQSPIVGHVSTFTLLRKDGTELPVELIVNAVGTGPKLSFHAFARDMTVLAEARAAQHGSEATFEAVFDNAPIGIAVVGLDGTFERSNQALCTITGYSEQQLAELTFQDITHPNDLNADVAEATRLMNGEITSYQMDKRYYAVDGHLIWVRLSASMVRDEASQPLHFIAHIEDISARKRDEDLLRRQATRDALTGVLNRTQFEEALDRYQVLARRHGNDEEAAILMIDLDGLKEVNDQGGHAAGDDYLKSVAATIGRRLRLSDVFARIGGDEFAVILPHTSVRQAQTLARTLAELVTANTCGSVSIGIGMLGPGCLEGSLARADQAMYQAKQRGGGRAYGP